MAENGSRREIHIGIGEKTQEIRTAEFTTSDIGDAPMLPEMLDQIPPDPAGTGDCPRHGRWCLRHPQVPRRHHRQTGYLDHPHPQEGTTLARGLTSCNCPEPDPARHPALRPGILAALDRISRPKSGRGGSCPHRFARTGGAEPARPQGFRRTHRHRTPRQPNRRNPDPRRPHRPLQRARHRRDRSHGLSSTGKGQVTPQASATQQRRFTWTRLIGSLLDSHPRSTCPIRPDGQAVFKGSLAYRSVSRLVV